MSAPGTAARLLAAPSPTLTAHLGTFGPRPAIDFVSLLAQLEQAGLDGRGGAGFPASRKIAATAEHVSAGRAAIVVGNGSEGEPLSAKDRVLLTAAPHLVIDGLLTCADALNAAEVHLAVSPDVVDAVAVALAERSDARLVQLDDTPHSFVAGEASAVVAGLAGRTAIPTDRRVRLAERGLRRRPTLVQNVETLAHIALVSRFGADWHRAVGVPGDAGTRLVSISQRGGQVRVFEVVSGTPLRDLLPAHSQPPSAVLVGGYHGTWLPAAAVDAPFSRPGLASWGATPGAGIVHALPAGDCGVNATAEIMTYLAAASARQCGPCLNGLPALAHAMNALAAGQDSRAELTRLTSLVEGRGACAHPDGSIRMLRSALTVFADDMDAHTQGICLAHQEVRA